MRSRSIAFLTLFTSLGTLICCALPAMLVLLGMGATVAAVVSAVPQLIWLSEHKVAVFSVAGALLVVSSLLAYSSRSLACPVDPDLQAACKTGRSGTGVLLAISWSCFAVGALFAFIVPLFAE